MKKIFASIVLPNLAAAAIIGSGFSVWFFGENQDKVFTTASIKVENCVKIGEVTTYKEVAVLHVDQTKGVRNELLKAEKTGKSDFGRGGVEANGIYLAPKEEHANLTGNINYNQPNDQDLDSIDGTCKLKLVTEFKFEGGIKDFVGMKDGFNKDKEGTMKVSNDDGYTLYTFTWATQPTLKWNYAAHLPVRSDEDKSNAPNVINFAFKYLEYDSSKHYLKSDGGSIDGIDEKRTTYTDKTSVMATVEPHNDAEYSEMLTKIGEDSKVIITTTATIVAV